MGHDGSRSQLHLLAVAGRLLSAGLHYSIAITEFRITTENWGCTFPKLTFQMPIANLVNWTFAIGDGFD